MGILRVLRRNTSMLRTMSSYADLDASMNLIFFSHYNQCPRLSDVFVKMWRNAGFRLRDDILLHDLITLTLLRSKQHGIVVIGILDAFVYAHNFHRRNSTNPGKFEDCTEGHKRLMTAITPSYAHAFQSVCLAKHPIVYLTRNFACRQPRPSTRTSRTIAQRRDKGEMTTEDGRCLLMEQHVLETAEQQQDGALSPGLLTEDAATCSAQ